MNTLNPTTVEGKELIILSGGKTMGHVTPLIAIYEHYKNRFSFLYFGLKDSMEERECRKQNIPFFALDLLPFYRKNLLKNYHTFKKINKEKKRISEKLKTAKIRAIFTSGGFVSIPVVLASRTFKCKKILFEANAVMGLANKWLSLYVDMVITQFDINSKYFNLGYPILNNQKPSLDLPFFYQKKPLLLFVGGSNGALEIVKFAYQFHLDNPHINCVILTGNRYYDLYDLNNNAIKFKRIENVSSIFKYFNVIVSRSGGATISELFSIGSKAVLIPSRNVVGDHQYHNAINLKEYQNFKVALDYEEMKNAITDLLSNDKKTIKKNFDYNILDNYLNV